MLQLPVFYTTQRENQSSVADVTADLILHRIKVSTGLSGPVTYRVDITGRDRWTNAVNVTLPNSYVLNNVNLSASALHDVPIYQRNENLKLLLLETLLSQLACLTLYGKVTITVDSTLANDLQTTPQTSYIYY